MSYWREPSTPQPYGTLRTLGTIFKIVGWVVVGLGIILAFVVGNEALRDGEEGWTALVVGLTLLATVALPAAFLLFAGELAHVLIDMQGKAGEIAKLLRRRRVQPSREHEMLEE